MSIESKVYIITQSDNSKWSVPVFLIAENRARYYAENRNIGYDDAYSKTLALFESDDYEIEDWAKNNMNWSDVIDKTGVMCVKPGDCDYEDGWRNGEAQVGG